MKKKILSLCLVVALAATAIVGASMAYLTDTDSDVNVMTLGNVKIEQIEQERDANGNLVDFTPAKPAYPAVGNIKWDDEGVTVNGTEYKVFDDGLKNVVDKIVTVKNTGKSDAYVRTIIAIEAPDYDPNDLIHVNVNGKGLKYTPWTPVEINGVKYVYSVFTYDEALAPGAISAPSLMQVFLDSEATNEDVAKFGDTWEILVLSQAVQTAGFDNAATALNTAFGEITATNHPWASTVFASTAEELADALTSEAENIDVILTDDIALPITSLGTITGGSGEYKLGGENTKNITIDLAGNKLTITTTYWSAIGAKNADAVFTIKNGSMTSSQATGTWNSYDVTFANCNYVIEDVVFEKAVAFTNAGKSVKMNNVTINEKNGDYYAMWISAKGQNIDIDGLTINTSDDSGRGIKIDEQYVGVDAVKKVTLNVSNATFNTAKKAAILVKSAAGADITLGNVDITGVTADSTNAVWVDADASSYADLVTVTGGTVITES